MQTNAPQGGGPGRPGLVTLGGLALVGGARQPTGAATQRRPLAVLAVLALAGDRGVSRDRLQLLFWPESDTERARKVLAQTVYSLRRDLGDPHVVLGTTELRLNADLVSADVTAFERAIDAGELERAAVLYAGPFLDGVHLADAPEFERWAQVERDRLERRALEVLERLAVTSEGQGDWEVALAWWRRRAQLDPLNGRTAARLMAALAAAGDLAGALRHARVHETLVRDELGAPLDPVVREVAERLKTSGCATSPSAARRVSTARDDHRPSADTILAREPSPSPEPEPTRPTPPSRPEPPIVEPRRRIGWRIGPRWGAAIAIVGVLLAALLAGRRPERDLDRTLVVVVPFDVADGELRLWREGMVDVLARNLDGAGPLHTISPTVVAREWTGRADRETVRAFAQRYRAGSAVYGQLLRAGADSVRASVTLLDVASGRALAELRRQDARSHMDHLTDSLTVDVLRALGGAVAVGAGRAAYLGRVTSIEALRAFLHGEQFYRRALWDSAVGHYQRAVALDSAFALAWRRLGLVVSWQRLQQDSLTAVYLLRAGAANRGLGARDSLLVAADSLSAASNTTASTVEAFGLTRRLFTTLDEAARRYPGDPEVWFAVGEARYHFGFGPVVGVDERATLEALDRAIALDSTFAPAYIHAVELGFNVGGVPLGLRYARPYLALNPSEAAHRGVLLIEPLVDPQRARSPEVEALLDTARTSALVSARTILRRWPDDAETAVRLSRLLAEGRPSEYPLFADTGFMRRRLAEQLAFRGRLVEASRVLGVRDLPIFAELAHLGAVPPVVAQSTLLRWARDGSGPARLALPYWSAHRDTAAITLFLGRVPALASRSGAAELETRARMRYDSMSALAHLALARGDSVTAIGQLLALPDTLCAECYLDRLTRARVLRAAGRGAEALRTLDEALVPFLTPIEVLFALERAHAAQQTGNRELATAACRFVRAAWSQADPTLRTSMRLACGAAP